MAQVRVLVDQQRTLMHTITSFKSAGSTVLAAMRLKRAAHEGEGAKGAGDGGASAGSGAAEAAATGAPAAASRTGEQGVARHPVSAAAPGAPQPDVAGRAEQAAAAASGAVRREQPAPSAVKARPAARGAGK